LLSLVRLWVNITAIVLFSLNFSPACVPQSTILLR
jgi:hypothetical protein